MAEKGGNKGQNGRQCCQGGKRVNFCCNDLAFTLSEAGSKINTFEERCTQPTGGTAGCREAAPVEARNEDSQLLQGVMVALTTKATAKVLRSDCILNNFHRKPDRIC